MKRVVSVSLGSSSRDHSVEMTVMETKYNIERIGTNGSIKKAIKLIKDLDGKVDAFGMGGIDLYISIGKKRYTLREAESIAKAAEITPIVDGSGLKNTLERKVIDYLDKEYGLNFKDKKVLLVCGLDRFGMAESFSDLGCDLVLGDLIFAFGIPWQIKSLKILEKVAKVIAPIARNLPIKYLYPTGNKESKPNPKYAKFYNNADIIAGDFHFIKKHLPPSLEGKTIITNTVTGEDVELLKSTGAKLLVTTTPSLNKRSFGTNVIEGLLVTLADKPYREISPKDYSDIIDKLKLKPWIEVLNEKLIS